MRRDLDLIRKILICLSEYEHGNFSSELTIDGFTDEQIGYHCFILKNAGLIRAFETTTSGSNGPTASPIGLTWEGHEFVDNAQDENVWKKVKNKIKKTSGTVSFSILTNILAEAIKEALK